MIGGRLLNRQALRFVGIAIAVSVVLAFPMEQVTHSAQAPGFYWFQNSCGSVEFLLTLGIVVQAILTPALVFLLPDRDPFLWGRPALPLFPLLVRFTHLLFLYHARWRDLRTMAARGHEGLRVPSRRDLSSWYSRWS